MFELYYSIWKDAQKIAPRRSFFREVWPEFPFLVKIFFILYAILGIIWVILLTQIVRSSAFYLITLIVTIALLANVLTLHMALGKLYLKPNNTVYKMKKDFAIKLYGEFAQVGIKSASQVLALREEALRITQQKVHSREVVVSRVIDIFVVGFLFWSLTLIIDNVNESLGVENAITLALFVVVLVAIVAFSSRPLWDILDILTVTPQAKLENFSDCLFVIYMELLHEEALPSADNHKEKPANKRHLLDSVTDPQ